MVPSPIRSMFFVPVIAADLMRTRTRASPNPSPPSPTIGPVQTNVPKHKHGSEEGEATKFNKVTPNLVVADIEKSLKFYRDDLGFSVSQTVPDKSPFIFAWMKRNNAEFFLNQNMPPQPGEPDLYAGKTVGGGTLSLYLAMEGIDELYANVQQRKFPS